MKATLIGTQDNYYAWYSRVLNQTRFYDMQKPMYLYKGQIHIKKLQYLIAMLKDRKSLLMGENTL